MSQLTVDGYEAQAAQCDNKCVIDETKIKPDKKSTWPCVTCPFCKEIVSAEVTPTTIHCPACKITVKRG